MKKLLLLCLLCYSAICVMAQKSISGNVTDEKGNPLSGAVVQEKGTDNGVLTSLDGRFMLVVQSDSSVLRASYLGYDATDYPLGPGPAAITLHRTGRLLNEIAVVGTRSKRSATETAVPVDIIPVSRVINASGQVDLNQIMQFVAPSFNSNRQSGADGADHIDPATLRGLGPDQTLVLINGKRRHQSSLINLYGTRGRGNTGTDLNTIPAASIERIEILRDGAAAQYGSDAIAGVINIVLKKTTGAGTANVSWGTNITGYGSTLRSDSGKILSSRNDGNMVNASVNYGLPVKKEGYLNLTADVQSRDKTFRPNYTPLYPDSYRDQFGDASITNISGVANFGIPLGKHANLYSFGTLGRRMGDAFAWTRTAGSERNVTAIYPDGFNPHIQSTITDAALTAGVTTMISGWNADFNATYGSNRFHYEVDKSLNASLEALSPTHFDAGGHSLAQIDLGAQFNRQFAKVAQGLNLAFGLEYRHEQYKIFAGEEASWKTYGPVIFSIDNGDTTYRPGGSQGFPGARPENEVDKGRNNIGGFVDAEIDLTKKWLMTGAIRLENYSDFGFTANYKFSTRYKLTPNIFLRGSASTGFRAPSLPQIYYNTTFTDVVAGKTIDKLIANNESSLAKSAGIPKLKQETSTNLSIGLTATPLRNLTITIDGYQVAIKDRIVLTGAFGSDSVLGPILDPLHVGAVQFFTNALDTKTTGLDIVASYNFPVGKGRISITAAANFNKLELEKVKTNEILAGREDTYFGLREQYFLKASAPKSKASFIVDYKIRKLTITGRATHFSKIELINWRALGDGGPADSLQAAGDNAGYLGWVTDVYQPRTVFDLSFGYAVNKHINIIIGGNNIFDTYPSRQDPGWTEGGGMWDAVQMGIGGAYYYGRIVVKF